MCIITLFTLVVLLVPHHLQGVHGFTQSNRKTALMQGDILIGALVSVHHQPKAQSAKTLQCGQATAYSGHYTHYRGVHYRGVLLSQAKCKGYVHTVYKIEFRAFSSYDSRCSLLCTICEKSHCTGIREQYGIQRVEAAFMAVDEINANPKILPGIKLGIEIRDSCWYSAIALEQSLEFIRDALSDPDSSRSFSGAPANCPRTPSRGAPNKNIVGVVGPGASSVTIQVQNLLQLFNIPQVGYSATSRDLSDKGRFSDFLRVVPSDYYQAQVMVDIVKFFNWTYVSAVHTDGNYGQSGMTAFRELAEENNVCIAKEDTVLSNAHDAAYDEVLNNLEDDKKANVVVCFCEGMTVRNLFRAAKRNNLTSRFLFIGSDGWADRTDVVEGIEETFVGGISVKIKSPYVNQFDDKYFALKPFENKRNPWFEEFWQHKFNCSLPVEETQENLPNCTGDESLSQRYSQDTKMSFVMKAVYTMAYGLHNLQSSLCGEKPNGMCKQMLPINGSLLRNHLMNVTFEFLNETVSFDSSGDPPGRYEIMNFQRLANGSFDYVKVGAWNNGTLDMHGNDIVFNTANSTPPVSVCSNPCNPGEAKSYPQSGEELQSCCWVCDECKEGEYLHNETTCAKCPQYYWPFVNKTGCEEIEVDYPKLSDDQVMGGFALAIFGLLLTLLTTTVFLIHNHTHIVKASDRELTYIIFVGMMISYLSSVTLLWKPNELVCGVSRVLPGFSFSIIYGALVTKTNRIARILAGNKKIVMRKHRFMSVTSQVIITFILILVELIISIAMLVVEPAKAALIQNEDTVKLECITSPLGVTAPLLWDFFLIGLCTLYAIKTRNLPGNFNEAKHIGFSMYTTCVIWAAWVTIYFGSTHKVICMSVCTSMGAMVPLVLLFFPKLYFILLKPEMNNQTWVQTTTDIQCNYTSRAAMHCSDPLERPRSYVGIAALMGAGQSLRQPIMTRLKTALQRPPSPPGVGNKLQPSFMGVKRGVRREVSLWSEASGSATTSTFQTRELMLQKEYGSQLDIGGDSWPKENAMVQTTDDLLDPLIPRFRRRVAKAVRESSMEIAEGREFFSITHGWMNMQIEAAREERKKILEGQISAPGSCDVPPKVEIIREYLNKPAETASKDVESVPSIVCTTGNNTIPTSLSSLSELQGSVKNGDVAESEVQQMHLPLTHKPNILDQQPSSDQTDNQNHENCNDNNHIKNIYTPLNNCNHNSRNCTRETIYTNGSNVGISAKRYIEKKISSPISSGPSINKLIDSLKYTSSLKIPKKKKQARDNILLYSTINGSAIVQKSISTDSLKKVYLDSEEITTRDCSDIFKGRKTQKNFNGGSRSPSNFSDKKSLIVSIVDGNNFQQPNESVSTRTIMLNNDLNRKIETPATLITMSDSSDKAKLVDDVGEAVILCNRTGESASQAISIKDEVEPIPRPERTDESMRYSGRRRSRKKSKKMKREFSRSDECLDSGCYFPLDESDTNSARHEPDYATKDSDSAKDNLN